MFYFCVYDRVCMIGVCKYWEAGVAHLFERGSPSEPGIRLEHTLFIFFLLY